MSDVAATTSVPEPAHVESWLRTLTRFEDARVVTVVPLTEGLSNVTVRVDLTDAPAPAAELLNRALTALRASTPSGGRLALCHGDPNPFNYLFRGQHLVAVVDWEQALISDPRSDIGQLAALSHLKGAAPYGPPSENVFVQLY